MNVQNNNGQVAFVMYAYDGNTGMTGVWQTPGLGEGMTYLSWSVANVIGDGHHELIQMWRYAIFTRCSFTYYCVLCWRAAPELTSAL